jgi:hypothetical protein
VLESAASAVPAEAASASPRHASTLTPFVIFPEIPNPVMDASLLVFTSGFAACARQSVECEMEWPET